MGIAVADEGQHRLAGAIACHAPREPDLAGTTLHLVGKRMLGLGERCQLAAELDHIAIAIVPLVEQGEIILDLVDRRHPAVSPRPVPSRGIYEKGTRRKRAGDETLPDNRRPSRRAQGYRFGGLTETGVAGMVSGSFGSRHVMSRSVVVSVSCDVGRAATTASSSRSIEPVWSGFFLSVI